MDQVDYFKLQAEGSDWSYGSKWGDQMEQAVVELLRTEVRNKKILEIGCGEGRGMIAMLAFGAIEVHGIDVAPDKIAAAKARGLNVQFMDMHKLNFADKYFDYIFTSHALEHCLDLKTVLMECIRVTKDKIIFIIPIRETKEFVAQFNPSHTYPINDPKEVTDILDSLNLKYHWEEKVRMCHEMWCTITL